ncbi:MAG: hypothetical protein J6T78_05325 [Bacteroidaceae bacterium]|nr:hypothetical protein [Bacteroidaceae bacterium]
MKNLFLFITFCFTLFASAQEPVKVKVKEPGTLSALLTQAQQDTCQYLVVSGKLNSADIKVLRKMAGADGRGKLKTLNLMDATIVSGEVPYLTIRNAEERILAGMSYEYYEPTSFSLGPLSNHFDNLDFHLEDDRYSPISRGVMTEEANYVLLGDAFGDLDIKVKTRNLAEWKSLEQQKLNGKGHRISKGEGEHYTYNAFTYKKLFCLDMFYRCPNLKLVVLPRKGKIYGGVAVAGDTERRYIRVTKKKAKN